MTDNLRGALWILAAAACAAGMIICVRALNGQATTIQIVFVRCVIGVAIVYVFSIPRGGLRIRTSQWKLQLLRGFMSVIALTAGFYSVSVLPLATVTVLFFTAPLFVTVLAVPFFDERVGWRRALATATGFGGAVVVLRPDVGHVDANMLIAIGGSMVFAAILLLGKKLSRKDDVGTLIFYAMGVAGVCSAPFAVMTWIPLGWTQWALIIALAVFGTMRNVGDTKGYAIGEASVMAPFQYTRIVIVAIGGYVLFNEKPDAATWIGGLIIMGSSLYIAHREARIGYDGSPRNPGSVP